MSFLARYLTVISGLTLTACVLSANSDLSLFSDNDPSIFTADIAGSVGDSDLFLQPDYLGSNAMDLDTSWLTSSNDLGPLEASCPQTDTQANGKARKRGAACFVDTDKKPSSDPVMMPSNLQETPVTDEEPNAFLELDTDDPCPPRYGKRLCCEGPGLQTISEAIWDSVEGCAPCRFSDRNKSS